MAKMDFEARMAMLAQKYGFSYKWEALKFGFKRAVIQCNSHDEYMAIGSIAERIKGVYTTTRAIRSAAAFEGYVYLMKTEDFRKLNEMLKEEQRKVEEWWQRYHVADPETRRLMACGAIQ